MVFHVSRCKDEMIFSNQGISSPEALHSVDVYMTDRKKQIGGGGEERGGEREIIKSIIKIKIKLEARM